MTIDGPPDWAITMFVKSVFFMGDSIAQRGIGRVARVATFPRDGVREGRACRDRFLRIGA